MKQTVNSIFREYAPEYLRKYKVSDYAKKIIRAIIDCRTEELGGHIQKCDHCGDEITLYNSCRNKHCPQCQFMKKEQWKQARQDEVLPYQYFHVVFTLPDSLNPIVFRNKRTVYKLLFDKVKETLLTVAEDEKYFGAKIGFFSILHTWSLSFILNFATPVPPWTMGSKIKSASVTSKDGLMSRVHGCTGATIFIVLFRAEVIL